MGRCLCALCTSLFMLLLPIVIRRSRMLGVRMREGVLEPFVLKILQGLGNGGGK